MRLRSRSPWYRDQLCCLPNHHALYRALRRSFARGDSVALVLLDVDHMKRFNYQLGHSRGDHALQQIAAGLEAALPPGASIYRIGGNHFAAVLPGMSEAEARSWAETGRSAAVVNAAAPQHAADVAPVTLKAGVPASPGGRPAFSRRALERLVMQAEHAWKYAAESGRDCVRTFSEPALHTTAPGRPLY
jgi:diguanylate cyclase (GGDEF)-like protein